MAAGRVGLAVDQVEWVAGLLGVKVDPAKMARLNPYRDQTPAPAAPKRERTPEQRAADTKAGMKLLGDALGFRRG